MPKISNQTWEEGKVKFTLFPFRSHFPQKQASKKAKAKASQKGESSLLKEECNICHKQILIRELRKHLWDCQNESQESDEGGDALMQSVSESSSSEGNPISPPPPTSTSTQPPLVSIARQPELPRSNIDTSATSARPMVDLTNETSLSITPTSSNVDNEKLTVDEVTEKTVQYCRKNDINNPVEILRCLQLHMVTGRALEIEFPHEEQAGETNFIMVDRQNLLQTALDEVSCLKDFRKTLEVQFYDEVMLSSCFCKTSLYSKSLWPYARVDKKISEQKVGSKC